MLADDILGEERGRAVVAGAVVVIAALGLMATAAGPVVAQSDTITLTVSVVDQDGDPVPNATVTASWDGGSTHRTTAANGKVFLDVPAGETVTFAVDHPDYVRNRPFRATRTDAGTVTIPVARTAGFTVAAADDAGDPIEGATVSVARKGRVVARGHTDADGRYSTGAIEVGTYDISVTKPDYLTRRLTEDLGGAVTRRLTLETGSVEYRVRVRDDHFDPPRPIANATVQVGSLGSVRTLSDGQGSIGVPVNTVQTVEVTKPGYRTVTQRVQVGESPGNVTIATRRSANVSVVATNRRVVVGERVTVEVRDAYGDPVEGATVLMDGSSVGTTGADGRFAVPVEERGSHELRGRVNALTSDPVTVEGVVPADGETPTTTATATDDGTASGLAPGFGVGAAVAALALIALAGLVGRRL
ncbi:MAG: carboxypeptidase regulatory-like domain-containing protein [Haloferacaceae archaeon]